MGFLDWREAYRRRGCWINGLRTLILTDRFTCEVLQKLEKSRNLAGFKAQSHVQHVPKLPMDESACRCLPTRSRTFEFSLRAMSTGIPTSRSRRTQHFVRDPVASRSRHHKTGAPSGHLPDFAGILNISSFRHIKTRFNTNIPSSTSKFIYLSNPLQLFLRS